MTAKTKICRKAKKESWNEICRRAAWNDESGNGKEPQRWLAWRNEIDWLKWWRRRNIFDRRLEEEVNDSVTWRGEIETEGQWKLAASMKISGSRQWKKAGENTWLFFWPSWRKYFPAIESNAGWPAISLKIRNGWPKRKRQPGSSDWRLFNVSEIHLVVSKAYRRENGRYKYQALRRGENAAYSTFWQLSA